MKRTPRPSSVYTAQTLADFCEVDLKTVHHWADKGKVTCSRTEGGHLRFRRNDVVRFLRAHGYPLPDSLVRERPVVALALLESSFEGGGLTLDDFAKRLGSRFSVRRYAAGAVAAAHLIADPPDALLVSRDDPSLGFPAAITAWKSDPQLSWIVIAMIGDDAAGADVWLAKKDVAKLTGELARTLAVV